MLKMFVHVGTERKANMHVYMHTHTLFLKHFRKPGCWRVLDSCNFHDSTYSTCHNHRTIVRMLICVPNYLHIPCTVMQKLRDYVHSMLLPFLYGAEFFSGRKKFFAQFFFFSQILSHKHFYNGNKGVAITRLLYKSISG